MMFLVLISMFLDVSLTIIPPLKVVRCNRDIIFAKKCIV